MKRERGVISDCTYNSKEEERVEEKVGKRRGWGGAESTQLEDEDNEFV